MTAIFAFFLSFVISTAFRPPGPITPTTSRPTAFLIAGERSLCDDLDHFYVTDAADRFARVAERFLGVAPSRLEAIEVYGGDALKGINDIHATR